MRVPARFGVIVAFPVSQAALVTFHLPGAGSVGRRTLVFGRDAPDGPWRIVHLHASVQQLPEESEGEG